MQPLAKEVLAGIDQSSFDANSPLALDTASAFLLETVLALLREQSIDVAACMRSSDEVISAAMGALKRGCSSKFIGTSMAHILVNGDREQRNRACEILAQGGYEKYVGDTSNVQVRHSAVGTCMLATANVQYVGPFVGGRMMGEGQIENCDDGQVYYKGFFMDNRPHGKGIMMNAQGTVHYEGMFAHGKPHGLGVRFDVGGELSGMFLAGHLCCLHGKAKFASASDNTVVTYHGAFWEDKRHGRGCMLVCNASSRALLSLFDGTFACDKKTGVGLLATQKNTTLGVWVNDKLTVTIASIATLTANAYHDLWQSSGINDTLSTVLAQFADRASTEVEVQTDETPPLPNLVFMVHVYSLCTLTSIPRKEFSLASSDTMHTLRNLSGGATVFFMNDFYLPTQYKGQTDIDTVTLETLLPLASDNAESVTLYFFRCPLCTQCSGVVMPTDGGHQHFDVIECRACAPRASSCVYCKICASLPNMGCNALFRLDKGLKHMQNVHGLTL